MSKQGYVKAPMDKSKKDQPIFVAFASVLTILGPFGKKYLKIR